MTNIIFLIIILILVMKMSETDLRKLMEQGNSIALELKERIKTATIVNIYTFNDECIKLGPGSDDKLEISSIISINDDFITIQYASHITNILYNAISKIEYF